VAANVPVLIGPDYGSFRGIVDALVENEGIRVVASFDDLRRNLEQMITDAALRQRTAQNAHAVCARFRSRAPIEQALLAKVLTQHADAADDRTGSRRTS